MRKKKGDFPHKIYEAQSFMFNTSDGVFSLQQKEFMKCNYSKDSNGSLKSSKIQSYIDLFCNA